MSFLFGRYDARTVLFLHKIFIIGSDLVLHIMNITESKPVNAAEIYTLFLGKKSMFLLISKTSS